MKLKYSLFTRRKFLNAFLAGGLIGFLSVFVYPVLKFLYPPTKEPDFVILKASDYEDMGSYQARTFPWGNKPALLIKNPANFRRLLRSPSALTVLFLF